MQTEIEAKFLRVDHDKLREKLRVLGAILHQPERLMRRKNFDFPDRSLEKDHVGWVRVRDEGDSITLAYKQLDDRTITGTKEVSVTVSSFDDTCVLLKCMGLVEQSYQETKRESWKLNGIEIELDEWPWVQPFIELEGPNQDAIQELAAELGLDWPQAVHGSVEIVYQAEYDVTEEEVDHWPEIVFSSVPDWLEAKRRK